MSVPKLKNILDYHTMKIHHEEMNALDQMLDATGSMDAYCYCDDTFSIATYLDINCNVLS